MIPDRIIDGYGLNIRMIDVIKTQVPPNEVLILTCDNGIACFEAIDYAKSLGMTVIVTDHHTVGEKTFPTQILLFTPHLEIIHLKKFQAQRLLINYVN